MNINITLIGQSVAFFAFVWFCMKYVWPPIMNALHERKTKIADGLAAAERGKHEQELAERRAADVLKEAKTQASEILNQAQKRANEIVEEAKGDARSESERIITAARAEIDRETNQAREQLRKQLASVALAAAGKVLQREVDAKAHGALLDDLAAKI